jgi:hypothetical protein
MGNNNLIDVAVVNKFICAIHHEAARAIYGLQNPRPSFLNLCHQAPDDAHFCSSIYEIGDTERMTADAVTEAAAGANVFIEPRLVRGGRPNERGKLEATQAVFAVVADSDHDTGKPFSASIPASVVVGTSPPRNAHGWYFLQHAVGVIDAVELGKAMRSLGGDKCSGNPCQPFRLPGVLNIPGRKKQERNRTIVPTKLLRLSDRTYTAAELLMAFSQPPQGELLTTIQIEPPSEGESDFKPSVTARNPAYCIAMAKMILAADPGDDRSARFMSAMNYAALGGLNVTEVEAIAMQHLDGCAGKYANRLRQEIIRCYNKIAGEQR